MNVVLSMGIIQSLCGQVSFKTGEAYYRAGKVTMTNYSPDSLHYEAIVKGKESFRVIIKIAENGDVDAECTCPALDSYHHYCQHIAAALLNIHDFHQDGFLGGNGQTDNENEVEDIQLTNRMLDLFGESPLRSSNTRHLYDTREILDVLFICKPCPSKDRKRMFGIEMKVGPKRLYTVKNIRDFLDRIERREGFVFTQHFIYDPKFHGFQRENDAVIRQLIQIYHNEKVYLENAVNSDRILPVPPYAWESLFPLLSEAPKVQLEQDGRTFDGFRVSEEPIPLRFEFDQAKDVGFQLDVWGLERITVMEWYGVVLFEGKLLKLQADLCQRLSKLKQMLETSRRHQIQIPPEQMELFMEKVIPGLMELGSVRLAPAVSNQIRQTPLKAKLFLDRVKDRLLAGLEFQYGDLVINPLEGEGQKQGTGRIFIRDGDKERRILELMDQSSFTKTEGGYIMHDEEAEYDFLYHILPQLEKLAMVYGTTAVKMRLFTRQASPKVTVDWADRLDWLEFRFDIAEIPESEIRNLLKSLEEKRKYFRLPNGALLPLESEEFQEMIRLMSEMGIRNKEVKGAKILLPVARGIQLIDYERRGHAVNLGKSFRELLENIRNPDHLDFRVPDSLAPILRDYQRYGFQWLKTLAHYRFGGILADDMGLGKTLQSIAFIVSELPSIRDQKLPAVIVAPSSLVYNWQNEMKKFAPEILSVVVDGGRSERSRALQEADQADVIITSYPLLRRDMEWYGAQSFHTLILDEAQVFKNHTTQTAKAVKEIKARYRFALTGTPVENRLEELWSIFNVVFSELFPGRKAFNELSGDVVAKRIRPFLLRRLKTDVLKELPEKIETLQVSELHPEQKKLYVAYLAELQQETVKHLNKGFQKNRIKILAGLTRLRQLCCHPALFVEGYCGSSAKFEQLMEIVAECRSAGKRLLVFSQFTGMLGLIGRELGDQGVPYFYLDGQTPSSERIEQCSRFNQGERDLFLISLKAGGTGLNLTGADTVILYDLWWNPAVEQQAADRAHRIGQKNVVQVIRLVAQGTIEEKMYELQQKKKDLIEEVIQEGQRELSALTEQEIREILMIPLEVR